MGATQKLILTLFFILLNSNQKIQRKTIHLQSCQKIHSGAQKTNPKTITSENGLFFMKEDMNTYKCALLFIIEVITVNASYCIVLEMEEINYLYLYL